MDLLVKIALERAVAAPGCPICRVGEEEVRRYLRFVLHELVNDLETRSRLRAAWGFCRRHAWHFLRFEWETYHDAMSTANIAEGLIESAEHVLDGYLAAADSTSQSRSRRRERKEIQRLLHGLGPTGPCPACHLQEQSEVYALMVLLAILGEPAWQEQFSNSDGLCFSHLRVALNQEGREEPVRWLIEDQRRRVRELKADLSEYLRKHDYRFRQEPYGRESDAFLRATAALAGSWFELPGTSIPVWDGVGRAEAKAGEHG